MNTMTTTTTSKQQSKENKDAVRGRGMRKRQGCGARTRTRTMNDGSFRITSSRRSGDFSPIISTHHHQTSHGGGGGSDGVSDMQHSIVPFYCVSSGTPELGYLGMILTYVKIALCVYAHMCRRIPKKSQKKEKKT